MQAWRSAPARLREDANAEEDLAHGGYRDRLVVELLQNAADAAVAARPGGTTDVVLRLSGDTLTVDNRGAPLTAEGVVALASLRASAKRAAPGGQGADTVGRFGVGSVAVAAVAQEVVWASRTGAVRFSRSLTAQALAAELGTAPDLAAEAARRTGEVPLLRLPFADDGRPPEGWDTRVVVTVRPERRAVVADLLRGLDPTLLLTLPGLAAVTVDVDGQVQRHVAEPLPVPDGAAWSEVRLAGLRWRVVRGGGVLAPDLVAGLPVEERSRSSWSAVWALPVDVDGSPVPLPAQVAQVLRAPTPTDEPLSLPVVLAASVPVGADRRRVRPGAVTEAVLTGAAGLLPDLLAGLAPGPERLTLVPPPFAAGEPDAVLGRAVLAAWQRADVLPGSDGPVRAERAVVLEQSSADLLAVLDDLLADVLPPAWAAQRWSTALARLGVRRVAPDALVALLASADRPPSWWRSLYAALQPDRDLLGGLPVPLLDGRTVVGARGALLLDDDAATLHTLTALGDLGLRVVHPEAAHPLLEQLGAVRAEPRALLEDDRVRDAVERAAEALDDDELPDEGLVGAVLGLVGAAGVRSGELPWLAALPLRDEEGGWRRADELLLPGGPLHAVVDPGAGFGVADAAQASAEVLAAVGVLRTFAAVPWEAVAVGEVDGLGEFLAEVPPGVEPGAVVRDLDLVVDWPAAVVLLRAEGLLDLPYVQWWLAGAPVVAGLRPRDLRAAEADWRLHGVLPEVPAWAAGLPGVRRDLDDLVADDPAAVLRGWRPTDRLQLRAVLTALAAAREQVLLEELPALTGAGVEMLARQDVVAVDRPDLLARAAPYGVLPVPCGVAAALAWVLGVALASEVVPPAGLSCGAAGGECVHEVLEVPDAGGEPVRVPWVHASGVDHVVLSEGRAQARAWWAGDWSARHGLLATGGPVASDLDLPPGRGWRGAVSG